MIQQKLKLESWKIRRSNSKVRSKMINNKLSLWGLKGKERLRNKYWNMQNMHIRKKIHKSSQQRLKKGKNRKREEEGRGFL